MFLLTLRENFPVIPSNHTQDLVTPPIVRTVQNNEIMFIHSTDITVGMLCLGDLLIPQNFDPFSNSYLSQDSMYIYFLRVSYICNLSSHKQWTPTEDPHIHSSWWLHQKALIRINLQRSSSQIQEG